MTKSKVGAEPNKKLNIRLLKMPVFMKVFIVMNLVGMMVNFIVIVLVMVISSIEEKH